MAKPRQGLKLVKIKLTTNAFVTPPFVVSSLVASCYPIKSILFL